jgi:hypothetical protein
MAGFIPTGKQTFQIDNRSEGVTTESGWLQVYALLTCETVGRSRSAQVYTKPEKITGGGLSDCVRMRVADLGPG